MCACSGGGGGAGGPQLLEASAAASFSACSLVLQHLKTPASISKPTSIRKLEYSTASFALLPSCCSPALMMASATATASSSASSSSAGLRRLQQRASKSTSATSLKRWMSLVRVPGGASLRGVETELGPVNGSVGCTIMIVEWACATRPAAHVAQLSAAPSSCPARACGPAPEALVGPANAQAVVGPGQQRC
jgi:hypothetical protein